jgi:hypothetical protein
LSWAETGGKVRAKEECKYFIKLKRWLMSLKKNKKLVWFERKFRKVILFNDSGGEAAQHIFNPGKDPGGSLVTLKNPRIVTSQ